VAQLLPHIAGFPESINAAAGRGGYGLCQLGREAAGDPTRRSTNPVDSVCLRDGRGAQRRQGRTQGRRTGRPSCRRSAGRSAPPGGRRRFGLAEGGAEDVQASSQPRCARLRGALHYAPLGAPSDDRVRVTLRARKPAEVLAARARRSDAPRLYPLHSLRAEGAPGTLLISSYTPEVRPRGATPAVRVRELPAAGSDGQGTEAM
jgi:hypothetical protein